MAKGGQKCWVWFKGIPLETDDGKWMGGWQGSVAPLDGIRCKHYEYVPCRLPQWRVSWDEPKDLKHPRRYPKVLSGSTGLLTDQWSEKRKLLAWVMVRGSDLRS